MGSGPVVTIERILELLARRRSGATLRELQEAFDLDAGERRELGRQLRLLERDGLVRKGKGGHFVAAAGRGRSVTGVITVHRDGYAFVVPDGVEGGSDLYVPAAFVRPAMSGDRVLVTVERPPRGGRREGRVVRVIERAHRTLLGRVALAGGEARLIPLDPHLRSPLQIEPGALSGAREGDVVSARLASEESRVRLPAVQVVEVFGAADDPAVEIRVAAEQFGLPYTFPEEVLAAARAVPPLVGPEDLAGREDLRPLDFVTIDGETARDFDDAVAISPRDRGFRLWVAIADVAHYVPPGSPIDREAVKRGTSVYFPGAALPMLPEELSNGICSLNPLVDRLVMVAELDFDEAGIRTARRFYPGVIRSRARLTYTEVAAWLNEPVEAAGDALREAVRLMARLAGLRTALRQRRGSLDFDLPEAEVVLGLRGRPEQIVRSERTAAHRLIEEFMLAANEAIAEWLEEQHSPVVYRIHEAPAAEKMAAFQEFLAHFNQGLAIPSEGVRPGQLQELLARVAGAPEEKVINHVLLRSLPQARYSTDNRGHFGLAATSYCHFTSPIRRYPDLLIHRLLRRRLQVAGGEEGRVAAPLEELAERSSFCERRAMDAERDVLALKKCQFMQERIGEEHPGLVVSVQPFGFFVELSEFFVEGLVHINSLRDDYYEFDEQRQRLVGMGRRRIFTIGDPVTIIVERVDCDRREIDFRLSGEPAALRRQPSPRREPARGLRKGRRR